MDLVVGSNTYLSVEDADDYWEGDTTWSAATDDQKQRSLRSATAYLDATFTWVGKLADSSQPLGWPRVCAKDSEGRVLEGIPQRVQDATAELAKLALSGALVPMSVAGTQGAIKREKLGPIDIEYEESSSSAEDGYSFVISLLRGIGRFSQGGGSLKVLRT